MNTPLWTQKPDNLSQTHLYRFMQSVGKPNYDTLYQWSIDCPAAFWKAFSEFSGIIFSAQATCIMQPNADMQKTSWFVDASLNFADNLLWRRDDHTALFYANENGVRASISYRDLYCKVAALAEQLKSNELKPGDTVAAFVTNTPETVIAMLATTSLGAIWSACGPEFGLPALVERFSQIEPKILFAVSAHCYNGKKFCHGDTIKALQSLIPSIQKVILIDTIVERAPQLHSNPHPFNHPLYILYSSGTTGKPKCIVHGAGNTLIQHKKELMLHTDLHENDTLFFYTTCSWMMWHWMISGLSVGATLVLYDGSPTYPSPTILLDLIDELKVSIFGCGAKMIETYLKNNVQPKNSHRLKNLKTILTTGSPLLKESFDYIYRDFKSDVRVSSISGGSDIISCFALGNPLLPVYAEELQCRGLGMAVEVFNDKGESVKNQQGELVCTKAFPSMPLYFWNDPLGEKYFNAYFTQFKNVWTHGDYAKITDHNGVIIYGRSDATLNPGGVRIGTADIYEQVLKIPDILDCVAAGKQINGNEAVFLFVTLKNDTLLNEALVNKIKAMIRDNTSPYHVPSKIFQVSDIPKTMNGKTMEIAVKHIINGRDVKNNEVLLNPECLSQFKAFS